MEYTVIGIAFDDTLLIQHVTADSIRDACDTFLEQFEVNPQAVFYGRQYDVIDSE